MNATKRVMVGGTMLFGLVFVGSGPSWAQTVQFAPAANDSLGLGITPRSLAVGEFTGGGQQDLAVVNAAGGSNDVSVLLGNGASANGAPTSFPAGSGAVFIAVGDFNGEGKRYLAVVNQGSNTVSVLINNKYDTCPRRL